MIRELAPAKVNLFLHVGNRRADGYHELESLVVFASVGDEITLEEAGELSFAVEGPFASRLTADTDNLVLQAVRKFCELTETQQHVRITLTKNLPVASGIGGGSSDTAATLRGLSRLWPERANLQALWNLGGEIGSDVAVCVLPGCWWMTGRGERFATINVLGTFDALLVNAGVPVATGIVYDALRERTGVGSAARPQQFSNVSALADYLRAVRNDLEVPARQLFPVIGETIDAIMGTNALLARMSGSGATCFGIYPDAVSTQAAAEAILKQHPNWWVAPTKLNYGRKWEFNSSG
ncbi:MAG: 4-(cytidine 5'-diphospho)-2-C-methyl-D-erythritol kinase [Alphaproteobacteria bacterium]|nr:4-(cytidine 5'-diphospho)-2-C-methyl-D-erythritol kinase [Alphaproteobacteria bacterium]